MSDTASPILAMPLPPRSPHPLAHNLVPSSSLSIQVSPLPIVSMLDHYIRRNMNAQVVAGALLGNLNESGDEVNVTDCFPIPFIDENELQLDTAYALKMYKLLRKTNQKEVVVGFYVSGEQPTGLAAQLHDLLDPVFFTSSKCWMHGILLTFDPTLKKDSFNLRGFLGLPIHSFKRKPQGRIYVPLPVFHEKLAKSFTSLEPISRASHPSANGTAPLLDETEMTLLRMNSLCQLLGSCVDFIENMPPPSTPEELHQFNQYGQWVAQALATHSDPTQLARMETEIRDFKTVVQLAEQAKRQIKISEKISFGMPSR